MRDIVRQVRTSSDDLPSRTSPWTKRPNHIEWKIVRERIWTFTIVAPWTLQVSYLSMSEHTHTHTCLLGRLARTTPATATNCLDLWPKSIPNEIGRERERIRCRRHLYTTSVHTLETGYSSPLFSNIFTNLLLHIFFVVFFCQVAKSMKNRRTKAGKVQLTSKYYRQIESLTNFVVYSHSFSLTHSTSLFLPPQSLIHSLSIAPLFVNIFQMVYDFTFNLFYHNSFDRLEKKRNGVVYTSTTVEVLSTNRI